MMGNDDSATNEHLRVAEDRGVFAGEVFGYDVIRRDYYERYNLPVMHAESNKEEPDAERWLWKTLANMRTGRAGATPSPEGRRYLNQPGAGVWNGARPREGPER